MSELCRLSNALINRSPIYSEIPLSSRDHHGETRVSQRDRSTEREKTKLSLWGAIEF
jgi:hypothetical protein